MLLLTNKHSKTIIELYKSISLGSSNFGDTFISYHQTSEKVPEEIKVSKHQIFTNDILKRLNYSPISNTLLPGSNHFSLLDFYLNNPNYDYYWLIEDDVQYNGSWKYFFKLITYSHIQPDFITSHVRTYQEEPEWVWWSTLNHNSKNVPLSKYVRSFNPIFRISNKAIKFIHNALIDQWQGHHEVLLPTLLFLEGFHIADFGGTGNFVIPGNENKFYITGSCDKEGNLFDGTMRYRPVIDSAEKLKNKLYHPVKF